MLLESGIGFTVGRETILYLGAAVLATPDALLTPRLNGLDIFRRPIPVATERALLIAQAQAHRRGGCSDAL